MTSFELITEYGRPVAAVVPNQIPGAQLRTIYSLLPPNSFLSTVLGQRWGAWAVCCTEDWANQQLHRVPCFKPKGQKLQLL